MGNKSSKHEPIIKEENDGVMLCQVMILIDDGSQGKITTSKIITTDRTKKRQNTTYLDLFPKEYRDLGMYELGVGEANDILKRVYTNIVVPKRIWQNKSITDRKSVV